MAALVEVCALRLLLVLVCYLLWNEQASTFGEIMRDVAQTRLTQVDCHAAAFMDSGWWVLVLIGLGYGSHSSECPSRYIDTLPNWPCTIITVPFVTTNNKSHNYGNSMFNSETVFIKLSTAGLDARRQTTPPVADPGFLERCRAGRRVAEGHDGVWGVGRGCPLPMGVGSRRGCAPSRKFCFWNCAF